MVSLKLTFREADGSSGDLMSRYLVLMSTRRRLNDYKWFSTAPKHLLAYIHVATSPRTCRIIVWVRMHQLSLFVRRKKGYRLIIISSSKGITIHQKCQVVAYAGFSSREVFYNLFHRPWWRTSPENVGEQGGGGSDAVFLGALGKAP